MTHDKMNRRLSAKLAAGLAISAFLVLGTYAASAKADDRDDGRRGVERHDEQRNDNRNQPYWDSGYYRAPPVIYAQPYYAPPPPVVYGPGIGVFLPGINVNIR